MYEFEKLCYKRIFCMFSSMKNQASSIADLKSLKLDSSPLDYIDVRIERKETSMLSQPKGTPHQMTSSTEEGAFLRAFHKGHWKYSVVTNLENLENNIKDLTDSCLKLEDISNTSTTHLLAQYKKLKPQEYERIQSMPGLSPRLGFEAKKTLVDEIKDFNSDQEYVSDYNVAYSEKYFRKAFASSQNIFFDYDRTDFGLVNKLDLIDGDDKQKAIELIYAASFEELKPQIPKLKEVLYKDGLQFLKAPTVTPGQYKVILDSNIAGVFAHESFGHKSEADFMLGDPEALKQWEIGSKVGSDCLSILDTGTETETSGFCPIDDEGFPTQKTYLIKNGILKGRLHSIRTAAELKEEPTGNSRSIGFEYEPIVRMTGTFIEPGTTPMDELIQKVDDGLYMADYYHGSGLSTFTIAPRKAYKIENGKITTPVKVSVITGSVFETLSLIEDVSSENSKNSSAFGGCGKLNQAPLPVSMGGPALLISKMQVG